MIDITTLAAAIEPISAIDITPPKICNKSTKTLWIILIIVIAFFGIWALITYSENQNKKSINKISQ